MKITQVRNATQIITYAGKKFLIDPMLAEKESYPGFKNTVRANIRIPTVELPFDVDTLLNVDAIIVTHTHLDHWDNAAAALIPKEMLIYVHSDDDRQLLYSQGFTNLLVLSETSRFETISLIKTACQHGSDKAYANPSIADRLGSPCGVIFKHPSEKTLYLIGDSIWIDAVEQAMLKHRPAVAIMNTCWAHILGYGAIIFGKEDVLKAHILLPELQIVATHMDAVNHCLITRRELLDYAALNQIQDFVVAPADGESIVY